MDGKQDNLDSHESGDSSTQELGGTINYPETMEELPMDAVKNRERGELVNEAVVNSFKGAEERSESIDPFWQSHPELFEEAKRMGAPLEVGEFKKEGFVFGEDADGKKHIWATTPEYRKWQEGGKEGQQPRHYESLDDQEYRKWREEYFAKLKNQLHADKEYREKVAERAREQAAIIERRQEQERERAAKMERIQELKDSGDIFSKEMVDLVCETEYPDGIYVSEKREQEIRQEILKCLHETYPDEQKLEKLIMNPAKIAYTEAFEKDELTASDDRIAEMLGERITWWNPDQLSHFKYDATRVWKQIMRMKTQQDIPVVMDKMADEDKVQIKHDAAHRALEDGKFFSKTFRKDPEAIDAIMEELGLNKNDEEIVRLALFGYGGKSGVPEIKYFDLENKTAELIDRGAESGLEISYHGDELYVKSLDGRSGSRTLGSGVSEKAMTRINEATTALTERLRSDDETGRVIESARAGAVEKEKRKLRYMIGDNLDFDYEHYLNTKAINVCFEDDIRKYVQDAVSEEPLGYFMRKNKILETLDDMPDMEVSVDFEEPIRNTLLKMFEDGWREDWKGRKKYDVAKIFETEGFKENQGRLKIDFNSLEMFEPAFNGFLNTLKSKNGEHSEQADWYYEAIFANDPGRFLAMVKAFKDTSDDIGAKRKITRFFENNEQAFNDKIKQEVEERFAKEINGEHKVIRTSVLKNAERKDIKNIIDEYKKDIIERVREKGGEEIDTFTGARTLSGERQETGTEERKETPFDFSIEKANALLRYSDFIENNIPDANVRWFTDTFVKNGNVSDIFKRDDSYIGFSFEYEGNLCVIAESLDEKAAMYLWRGEPGGDFKEMFDLSKYDAKRTDDPRIVSVDHLDKEHFDESLDLSYKKALLFFRTGNKRLVNYRYFGNNPVRAKRDWNEYQELEYPAWPLGIDGYATEPEDLEQYNAWHERQDEIQARLKEAVERGGQEELESERKRIAQEEYDRVMNEAM